jgi:hypothetical protein
MTLFSWNRPVPCRKKRKLYFVVDALLAFKPEELTDEELNQLLDQLEDSDDVKSKNDPEATESDSEAPG